MFGVWDHNFGGTRGRPALFVSFSTRQRGTRIRDPDVYACSDNSNRNSPLSSEGVMIGSGGREPSRLVSTQPGVSRRQWSQRSLSRPSDRTTMSSCPSKRHRIENRISTPPNYSHGRLLHRQVEQGQSQVVTDVWTLALGQQRREECDRNSLLNHRAFQSEPNAFTLKRTPCEAAPRLDRAILPSDRHANTSRRSRNGGTMAPHLPLLTSAKGDELVRQRVGVLESVDPRGFESRERGGSSSDPESGSGDARRCCRDEVGRR